MGEQNFTILVRNMFVPLVETFEQVRDNDPGGLVIADRHPLQCVVHSNKARQAGGAAKSREDAKLDLRLPHLGPGRNHPVGAGKAHLEAPAQRVAVDRTDTGKFKVFQIKKDFLGFPKTLIPSPEAARRMNRFGP
mgnify:CR=1 FL=1